MEKCSKMKKIKEEGNSKIMCKASELAKYTINECLVRGYKIDTPKVQKMLTLMNGKFLAEHGQTLFPENIEVWECGVAIRKVNSDFKSYAFGITEHQECYLALLDNEKAIIHSVIDEFGENDVFEINQDPRLLYIKNTYYDQKPVIVPNDFIRKVFLEDERSC